MKTLKIHGFLYVIILKKYVKYEFLKIVKNMAK